jgi:hypothetical protein
MFLGYNVCMINSRGIPTAACPACGSSLIRITVEFDLDTYEIISYLLDDAQCYECNSLITAPTPLDVPAL